MTATTFQAILSNGVLLNAVSGTLIQNNVIGLNLLANALANGSSGVALSGGASGNTIGGTATGVGNVIAFNTGPGVLITGNDNAILGNSIYSNGGSFGIDLGGIGVVAKQFPGPCGSQ